MVGGGMLRVLQAAILGPLVSVAGRKKVRFFIARIHSSDLLLLKDLPEAGTIITIIDRAYPLSEAAAAVRYREEGHARGKVVVLIDHPADPQAAC